MSRLVEVCAPIAKVSVFAIFILRQNTDYYSCVLLLLLAYCLLSVLQPYDNVVEHFFP